MTAVATEQQFTAEAMLRADQDSLCKLVNGNLIEKQMSELANETAGLITSVLLTHTCSGNL